MAKNERRRVKKWTVPKRAKTVPAPLLAPAPAPPPPPPPPPPAVPIPSTSGFANLPRSERTSAAERIHQNRGYAQSVKELLRRHPKLTQYEPEEATRDVFRFSKGMRSGVLTQTHVRFRFDYKDIQKRLLKVFGLLFALQGNSKDSFEVVITFNAILYCKDTNTYSLFYGTDHRENNRMGAANELGFGGTYTVNSLPEVSANIPCVFDMQDVIARHRNAFPNSNVSVFKIVNIIYMIYQFRR